jgi:hypothetical protein
MALLSGNGDEGGVAMVVVLCGERCTVKREVSQEIPIWIQ